MLSVVMKSFAYVFVMQNVIRHNVVMLRLVRISDTQHNDN